MGDSCQLVIYGIGGLGADERVFKDLSWNCKFKFIPWLKPNSNEALDAYAKRFAQQIDTDKKFILVGVSFGGILVHELCRFINPEKIVLISTAQTKKQIPSIFRTVGKLGLFKILPSFLIKPPLPILYWLFSIKEKPHKKLLKEIIIDTEPSFIKWALHQIANWKPHNNEIETIIIHGKNDRLIKPPHNLQQSHTLDGGHFIIIQKGKDISEIINSSIAFI